MSSERAPVYQEIGRGARVAVGEIEPLAPFARAGPRTALLWFLGTSLASLLLVDTDSPMLVISVLLTTTAFAVAALFAPSRGVHERIREAKREELARLRDEIARASRSLRAGDAAGAAPSQSARWTASSADIAAELNLGASLVLPPVAQRYMDVRRARPSARAAAGTSNAAASGTPLEHVLGRAVRRFNPYVGVRI